MAAIERPAAEERIAVLERSELPGRESMSDWAFDLGSGWVWGVVDWYRGATEAVGATRRGRWAADGRRRVVPAKGMHQLDLFGIQVRSLQLSEGDKSRLTRESLGQPHRHCREWRMNGEDFCRVDAIDDSLRLSGR
jgi:hypothetical protein